MTKQILDTTEKIVEMLFTDGQNRKASRLILEYKQENNQVMMDGTGWSKHAIKDKINEILVGQFEPPVKPANGGQIYLLYKRLLGYSDMTPILVAVFAGVEKALDEKYKLQKDDHANSYFIEDSRLSV